jgi:hypothetical protein
MYGPDSVFDVEPSDDELAEWRRADLRGELDALPARPGVAKVLKALRVRR